MVAVLFTGCGGSSDTYTVDICQLMAPDSLDQATQGFIDVLQEEMDAAGKMAAQILLEGKAPSDIDIATLTPTVTYNGELCATLGIAVPEN